MIQFFNSRVLSNKLNINLAKWKRWSREFLPPDPLGGKQSGYARQYSMREAFLVFMGGHLVGNLSLSIPEARAVLKVFGEWMTGRPLFTGQDSSVGAATHPSASSSPGQVVLVVFGGLDQDACFCIQDSGIHLEFNLDQLQAGAIPLHGTALPERTFSIPEAGGNGEQGKSPAGISGPTTAKLLFIHSLMAEFLSRLNPSATL